MNMENDMVDTRTAAYGALILRVALGVLLLAHFALKYFVFTPAGTAQFFGSIGLPPALAYLTMLVELVTGAALVLGVWTRLAALAAVPVLLGAVVFVHLGNGFIFSAPNGGWEYPAFWAVALIVQALIGDGAYALLPTPVKAGTDRTVAARS
jgi:putative oxidoreductase